MQKVQGFVLASGLLFAGAAQAFQLNAHTPPTMHQLNPQPLPPGMRAQTGGGAGKVMHGISSGCNTKGACANGEHIPK